MKGFKDTTKTHHITGKQPGPKGAARMSRAMAAFKRPCQDRAKKRP